MEIALVYDRKKPAAEKSARQIKCELEKRNHQVCLGLRENCLARVRLVITFGGDGLVMDVANRIVNFRIPLLRVNFGHVGFLSNIEPEEALARILEVTEKKNYIIVRKTRLEFFLGEAAQGNGPDKPLVSGQAFNEIRIERRDTKVITFSLRASDRPEPCVVRGDGGMIFTATGSTAYNMSAGGWSLFRESELGFKVVSPTAAAAPDRQVFKDDTVFEMEMVSGKARLVADDRKIANMENQKVFIRKAAASTYFIEIGDVPRLED